MAEKNITMKRKTAQGWDVYYPKTKGGNIIQDGSNRLVTDTEKTNWNAKETPTGAQNKANKALADAKAYVDGGWKQKHGVTSHDGTAIALNASTDLNTILDTGFYRGNRLVNAPTSDAWHYLMVTKHTESYVMQVASVLDSGFNKDKNTLFVRHLINKVWTTWRALSLREDWGLWNTNGGQDLMVHGKRALVGLNSNSGDKLHLNYEGDFKNGVEVKGKLTNDGYDVLHSGWNVMKDRSATVLIQDDWNAITESGLYLVSDDGKNPKHVNTPPNCYPYGVLEVYRTGSNQALFQRYTSHQHSQVFVRSAWAKASWSAWRRLADENIISTVQQKKITNDNGGQTISVSDTTKNILDEIVAKGTGMNTIYCISGAQGQTPNNKSWRGISYLTAPNYGFVIAKDFQNKLYTNYVDNGKWLGWVEHITEKDLSDGLAKQISKTGDTMSGNLNFDKTLNGVTWNMNTDYAKVYFKNDSDADTDSYLAFETGDNGNEHFKWLTKNGATTSEMMRLNQSGLTVKGKTVAINEEVDAKLNKKLNKTSDTTDDLHMINPKVVAGGSDHGYLGFYPRTKEPTKRGAYMGYGSAGTNLLTISNEIGDVNINSQGKVLLNNKEVATKDEVSSLVASVGQKFKLTQDDGRAISASGKSFNELQAGGYYMGAEMKDAPLPSTSNWWFIEIMRHANGWVHQRATWFNTTTVETYERILHNNAWQPWKKTVTPQGWGLWRTNGGQDLLVHDKRAMVGFPTSGENKLHLNYGKDFANGVEVQGRLTNNGSVVLNQVDLKNIMNYQSKVLDSNVNWDTLLETGFYIVNQGGKGLNSPTGNYDYGVLEVIDTGGLGYLQRYTSHMGTMVTVRGKRKADAKWSSWSSLTTSDSFEADMKRKVSTTGDTMTGQLTINMSGGKATPLVVQNSEGKMRILPYEGDSNYIQSGTTADEAKNLRITGYNGKQMQRVNINAVDTVVEGNLVAGKNISLNNGGEPNIYFHDHTSIFSRADRTGFYDRKEGKTHLAIDNGTKAVQVEGGYNLNVVNGGNLSVGNFTLRGQDFVVHGKRALVGTPNDRIHINYAKDMPNGVVSNGKLQVNDGQLYVTQNGKDAVIGCGANDAYLRNTKSGKYLQLKDDGTFSYDGKKVALTDEASHVKWSTFTNFQNGFKPLPEGHALFYGIDQFGFKHIRGLVQGGSTNAGAVIGKLPDFMKPSYWTSITATYDTTGSANYVPCAIHVAWGGELIVQNSRSASSFIVINGMYK